MYDFVIEVFARIVPVATDEAIPLLSYFSLAFNNGKIE